MIRGDAGRNSEVPANKKIKYQEKARMGPIRVYAGGHFGAEFASETAVFMKRERDSGRMAREKEEPAGPFPRYSRKGFGWLEAWSEKGRRVYISPWLM